MGKRKAICSFFVAGLVLATLAAYYLGRDLIVKAWHQESIGLLNRLIEGQATIPVERYLSAFDTLLFSLLFLLGVLLAGICVLAHLRARILIGAFVGQRLLGLTALLGTATTLVIYYPGFLPWDSVIQLLQARTGSYGDWHPPAMSAIWRYIDMWIPGPFGMLTLQVGLFWLGGYLFLREVTGVRTGHKSLLLLLLIFFPPVFGILGAVWKDLLFGGTMLAAFGAAMLAVRQAEEATSSAEFDKHRMWERLFVLILLTLFLVFAGLLRHNAYPAMFPLLCFVVFRRARPRMGAWPSVFTTGAVSVALLIGVIGIVTLINSALTDRRDYAWRALALFDIVAVELATEGPLLLDPVRIDRLGSLVTERDLTREVLSEAFSSKAWDSLARSGLFGSYYTNPASQSERDELKMLWLEAVSQNPMAYLRHRATVFSHVIGSGDEPLHRPVYIHPIGAHLYIPGRERLVRETGVEGKMTWYQLALRGSFEALSNTILYRPYVYVLAALLVLVGGVAVSRNDRGGVFFLASSGLCHEAVLFIAAPANEYRYSHWLVVAVWLGALVIAGVFANRNERVEARSGPEFEALPDD